MGLSTISEENWNKIKKIIYSHNERRSQFEHPGLGTSTIVGPMLPTIHGSASLQSVDDEQVNSTKTQRRELIEADEEFDAEDEDPNIINSGDVPEWLKLYSQAPFTSDHLLNFNLFKLLHLEYFDRKHFQNTQNNSIYLGLLMKLFKAEIVNTVRKYDRAISEIDHEVDRRHAALWSNLYPAYSHCSLK